MRFFLVRVDTDGSHRADDGFVPPAAVVVVGGFGVGVRVGVVAAVAGVGRRREAEAVAAVATPHRDADCSIHSRRFLLWSPVRALIPGKALLYICPPSSLSSLLEGWTCSRDDKDSDGLIDDVRSDILIFGDVMKATNDCDTDAISCVFGSEGHAWTAPTMKEVIPNFVHAVVIFILLLLFVHLC